MKEQKQYLYIQAWDRMMMSDRYWTERQIDQARRDNAPDDAIYYSESHKRWVRFSEITREDTKLWVQRLVEELKMKGGKRD